MYSTLGSNPVFNAAADAIEVNFDVLGRSELAGMGAEGRGLTCHIYRSKKSINFSSSD
jgi:hypothetical protein